MSYAIGSSQVRQRHIGITPIKKRYIGENVIWEAGGVPVISTFGVTPNTIDLDTRATGNVSFNVALASTLVEGPTPSTFTFVERGGSFWNTAVVGTRSLADNNLSGLFYLPHNFYSFSLRNKYRFWFSDSFMTSKFPINLIINGNPFSVISAYSTGTPFFITANSVTRASDQVTGGSLTKTVNFELVDSFTRVLQTRSDRRAYSTAFGSPSVILGYTPFQRAGTGQSNYYFFNFSGSRIPNFLILNGRPFSVRLHNEEWITSSIPSDLRPSSSVGHSITLGINIRFTDGTYLNNTSSFLFNTSSRGVTSDTTARILREPEGTQIGPTLSALRGSPLTGTIPNIPQPTKTTTYRLIARNPAGSSHREVTINVSQNAVISNLRRTGFSQRPDGRRYQFTARVKGYPRPAITWRFSNGTSSQSDNDGIHFTPVSGQTNTWDVVWGQGAGRLYAGGTTDSFTMTATNSSNSVSSSISNIST